MDEPDRDARLARVAAERDRLVILIDAALALLDAGRLAPARQTLVEAVAPHHEPGVEPEP